MRFTNALFLILLSLSVVGCANSRDMNNQYSTDYSNNDPLETVNRAIFSFNDTVDTFVIKPIAQGYRAIVPVPVRDAVRNFLRNLKSPINFANQVLQGDLTGAGTVATRFVVNSTIGVAGLMDVGENFGLEHEEEDFGQTLAVWGVPQGPYVVVPLLGPSNPRDIVGLVVDTIADPLNIYAEEHDKMWITYTRAGLTVIDNRARLIDPMDDLKRNSLDYYATIRSVYTQFRNAQVTDTAKGQMLGKPTGVPADAKSSYTNSADIPDYD